VGHEAQTFRPSAVNLTMKPNASLHSKCWLGESAEGGEAVLGRRLAHCHDGRFALTIFDNHLECSACPCHIENSPLGANGLDHT
jgi:hypothetical protein